MKKYIALGALMLVVTTIGSPATAGGSRAAPPRLVIFGRDGSLWSIRADGTALRRILARDRQHANRPALSPDRGLVLFDGTPAGQEPFSNFDIHVIRSDGTDLRRSLTTGPQWELDAQWMPNGRISFTRMPSGGVWRQSWVWSMRADGSDQKRLFPGLDAHWSRDGKKVLFGAATSNSDLDLFVANADGTGRRRLTATRRVEGPAGWSPDGRRILFSRARTLATNEDSPFDVAVMSASGRRVRTLAPGTACCWSPDGSTILYTSPGRQLKVMNANGARPRRIGRVVRVYDPDWR